MINTLDGEARHLESWTLPNVICSQADDMPYMLLPHLASHLNHVCYMHSPRFKAAIDTIIEWGGYSISRAQTCQRVLPSSIWIKICPACYYGFPWRADISYGILIDRRLAINARNAVPWSTIQVTIRLACAALLRGVLHYLEGLCALFSIPRVLLALKLLVQICSCLMGSSSVASKSLTGRWNVTLFEHELFSCSSLFGWEDSPLA